MGPPNFLKLINILGSKMVFWLRTLCVKNYDIMGGISLSYINSGNYYVISQGQYFLDRILLS